MKVRLTESSPTTMSDINPHLVDADARVRVEDAPERLDHEIPAVHIQLTITMAVL